MATAGQDSPYARLGGAFGVRALVRRIFVLIDELPQADALRRALPDDFESRAEHVYEVLRNGLSGLPSTSSERCQTAGQPPIRHSHCRIGTAERNAWLMCVHMALSEQVDDPSLREWLAPRLVAVAGQLASTHGDYGVPGPAAVRGRMRNQPLRAA